MELHTPDTDGCATSATTATFTASPMSVTPVGTVSGTRGGPLPAPANTPGPKHFERTIYASAGTDAMGRPLMNVSEYVQATASQCVEGGITVTRLFINAAIDRQYETHVFQGRMEGTQRDVLRALSAFCGRYGTTNPRRTEKA